MTESLRTTIREDLESRKKSHKWEINKLKYRIKQINKSLSERPNSKMLKNRKARLEDKIFEHKRHLITIDEDLKSINKEPYP